MRKTNWVTVIKFLLSRCTYNSIQETNTFVSCAVKFTNQAQNELTQHLVTFSYFRKIYWPKLSPFLICFFFVPRNSYAILLRTVVLAFWQYKFLFRAACIKKKNKMAHRVLLSNHYYLFNTKGEHCTEMRCTISEFSFKSTMSQDDSICWQCRSKSVRITWEREDILRVLSTRHKITAVRRCNTISVCACALTHARLC